MFLHFIFETTSVIISQQSSISMRDHVVLLLPVRSMCQGYAFVSVCVCTYMCVCRQKTRPFASYRSKISTKTLSAASSLNL